MTFAEKLKALRKQAGMSQEKLAEKIGVSRQAITKWETDTGIPDIDNILALSALFGISIDEFLSDKKSLKKQTEFLYESVTEYDIDEPKRYDMKLGGAKMLVLTGCDSEKIRVRLVSNTLATLQSDFKVKIDDNKKRLDVDISRIHGMTEAAAKESLIIFVQLPNQYTEKIEAAVNAETLELHTLECGSIQLNAKAKNIDLDGVTGTLEIDCNLDLNIVCHSLNGAVEINQVSATSRICVPGEVPFAAISKGIRTSITYEKNGTPAEAFCTPDADNVIELNGLKSELIICTLAEGAR